MIIKSISSKKKTTKKNLNSRQKKFVDEYLKDLNATQAAKRAGYSDKTAHSIGSENLKKPEIKKYIQERQERLQEKTKITHEKIIDELAKVAFDDSTDFTIDGLPIKKESIYKGSSKIKALELLGKHLGMFEKKAENDSKDIEDLTGLAAMLSDDENTDD